MGQSPIIEIDDLTFSYNGELVLDRAAFKIFEKDYVWIVGPNGGGKTTLLKLLLGLLKPAKGTIEIQNKSPEIARARIGYMTQHARLDDNFPITVMEVALIGCLNNRWFGRLEKEKIEKARKVLQDVGLQEYEKRPFAELSGGQRRRLLIARALVTDPDILILDEPTANLDQTATRELYKLLEELNKKLTILMVSHDPGFVAAAANRVICVNRQVHEHPTSQVDARLMGHLWGDNVRMVRHDQDIDPGK